ncbi:hypothetical protein GH714_018245 [Hevea brasiliensis]|uniref:Choline monooxygenase, chloroplastic n=1 Tax=Hevea brasiliensis TaxID=3981 RepID=A0A6A6MVW2_HEVBR|nr:hypothetical protein GH714_018245 [Hevea brasiliensis]
MCAAIMALFLHREVGKSLALYALTMLGLMVWMENFLNNKNNRNAKFQSTWRPFVLLNVGKENSPYQEVDGNMVENEWLGSCSDTLKTNGVDFSLSYVCRCVYNIECNWKIYEKVSIQRCEGGSARSEDDFVRLGSKALCAFIYPNFMINRYGPWMDTNLVLLLGPRKCQVIFDYFIEAYHKEPILMISILICVLRMTKLSLKGVVDSERIEDIMLCEGVQSGLESPEYCSGRYAPTVEKAMHHFHQLLHDNLKM